MSDENSQIDSVTEISRRRTVLNASVSYGRYAVAMLFGLVLQGYVIRTLGRDEYALWPLVVTCLGFVSLIPTGIGSGAGRFLAHALGRKDVNQVEQITTSLFVAMSACAILYLAAVICVSVHFERLFDVPEGTAGIGPRAFLLAGAGGAIALPFGVFRGGLYAAQRFVFTNALTICSLVLRLLLTVVAFNVNTPSLVWVATVQLAVSVAENTIVFLFARRVVPWQRLRWRAFDWSILKETSTFSLLMLMMTVAGLLYWRTDNILINKLLDPALVTGYAVVAGLVLRVYEVASLGVRVVGPVAAIMHAREETARLRRLVYRANRCVVPIVASLLLFLIVFGREVLIHYLGPQYAEYGALFYVLGASCMLSLTQGAAGLVPRATGRLGTVDAGPLANH